MLDARFHQQSIDHNFDGMVLALVEGKIVIQIHDFAVDSGPLVAVLEQRFHLFLELPFAPANDRRQDHYTILRSKKHYPLHDLLSRLAADRTAALRTMRNSNGSEQQAKIIVDLGDGSNGRPRAAAGGLLFNR